jgi:autotransporter-associated beta strand protein
MVKPFKCRALVIAMCIVAIQITARPAGAAAHTWTGSFGNSMNNAANWTGGVPTSGDTNLTLVFPFPVMMMTTNLTQDIANPLEVESLQIDGSYQFNGPHPMQFKNLGAAPTIVLNGTTFQNIFFSTALDFNAATTISNTGSSFKQITFQNLSGAALTFNGVSQTEYSLQGATANTLTGANMVTGMSELRLQKAPNTAAIGGSVTVDGPQATMRGGAANQFAAGTDVSLINGGTFVLNGNSQAIDELLVESSGMVTFAGSETLTINGQISSSAGVGTVGFGFTTSAVDFAGQFKTINVTSTGVGDMLRIREPIVNGSINKIGPGKLEVSNSNNNFTGTNVVVAGTLAGGPQSIGNVTNNDTVEFTGFGPLAANQITGPGKVVISNVSVDYQGAQSYTGGTFLNNGTAVGDASTLLGSFTATTGGGLQFAQNSNAAWTGTLSGPASLIQFGTGVLSLGGNNPYTAGTYISNGGINIQTDTAIGTGPLSIFGAVEATNSRTLANVLSLGTSVFNGTGNFNFTDTTTKQPFDDTTHNSTGLTNIAGKWINGANTITVNAGQLAIGDPTVVNGFTSSGPIVVNGGTLTVRSLNFITLPDVTLAGGTLNAPNGYAIPLGAVLQGMGGVTGRVASANGSTILASGNLTIGDAAHVAGVNLDGELYTDQFTVSLSDANQAVLGALTHLGDGTNNGTLNAPNGLIVNFGRNIAGRGQINSTNTPATAVIMNGDVQGDSNANYVEFTGYVKGIGTFNNVAFSGTFAPGLSPAVLKVDNVVLTSSNVLDIEIGGTQRGGESDGFDIAGTMSLGGELQVSLFNGFTPSLGDEWQLFAGATTGMFASYDLPALGEGLSWDTAALYTAGVLSVTAGLPGDFNDDGNVDMADYITWRNGLGNYHAPADLAVWQANFGRSAATAASLGTTVPEPTTWLMISGLAIGWAFSRAHSHVIVPQFKTTGHAIS